MKAPGIFRKYTPLIFSLLLAAAGIPDVFAQNMTPLTETVMQEPVVTAASASVPASMPAVASASAATQIAAAAPAQQSGKREPETRIRVGDVTQTLLRAQADGRVAGPRLPMLGVTADASWQRYLDSFRHPLPVFFENKISKSTSN